MGSEQKKSSKKKSESSEQLTDQPWSTTYRPLLTEPPTAHRSLPTAHYVELHARSAFSFLEGASVPEELIAACQSLQMPAMALLDRDGVYGSPRFHLAAEKIGIKAHIGAEITVVQGPKSKVQSPDDSQILDSRFQISSQKQTDSKLQRQQKQQQRQKQDGVADIGHWTLDIGHKFSSTRSRKTFSLPLLVANRKGYQNLCRLITLMKLRVPKHAKPGECAVTPEELAEYAEGLICLTGASFNSNRLTLNASGR